MIGKKHSTPSEAYLKATDLCARGEQCSYDMRDKFVRWGVDSDKIDELINRLIKEKYIDDSRYARAFCRDKARFQNWGRMKIVYQLRHKKISPDVIEDSLEGIDENQYEDQLLTILKSKRRSIKNPDIYKVRASLYRFAISRGFESALVMRTLPKVIDNIEEDEW